MFKIFKLIVVLLYNNIVFGENYKEKINVFITDRFPSFIMMEN
jgi:hypothetical protein